LCFFLPFPFSFSGGVSGGFVAGGLELVPVEPDVGGVEAGGGFEGVELTGADGAAGVDGAEEAGGVEGGDVGCVVGAEGFVDPGVEPEEGSVEVVDVPAAASDLVIVSMNSS
jgi:hypothetical protein